jgi:methylase of polypeptide subunit release factors
MDLFTELSELRVVDNSVEILHELDRSSYLKLNEILINIGGKWDKSKGRHVFDYCPRNVIDFILTSRELPPKNPYAYFPTPESVITDMVAHLLPIYPNMTFLESSAGTGHIINCLRKLNHLNHVTAFEIDRFRAAHLAKLSNVSVVTADFLTSTLDKKFDVAIINPPFSVEGNATCFVDHVQHTYNMLDEHGKMAAVLPVNWLTASTKKLKAFREWVYLHGKYYILPKNTFKESGTLISTCIIVIDKEDLSLIDKPYANYKNYFFHLLEIYRNNDNTIYELFKSARSSREKIWHAYEVLIDHIRKDGEFLPVLPEWKDSLIDEFLNDV